MSGPLALLSRRGLDVQYVLFAHRSSGNIDKLRSVGPCVHDGISWGCSAFHPSLSRVSVFSVFGSPCGLEFGVGPYNVYLLMTELTTKEPTTKTNAASFWMGEGSPSHFWRRKKKYADTPTQESKRTRGWEKDRVPTCTSRPGFWKDDQGNTVNTGAGSASRHGEGLGRVHPRDGGFLSLV